MNIELTEREAELLRDTMRTAHNGGNVYTERIRNSVVDKLTDALRAEQSQ